MCRVQDKKLRYSPHHPAHAVSEALQGTVFEPVCCVEPQPALPWQAYWVAMEKKKEEEARSVRIEGL